MVGIEFAASVVVPMLVGNWADNRWGTSPWLALSGVVVGTVMGFIALFKLLKEPQ